MEQRAGRIVRQGNRNKDVYIYRYVTEATFDAYLWQTVENKQKFISQIMTSKSPVRSCDDVDETALSYAEIKALCTGNPLIKEKMDLDIEVARLRLLKSNHLSQQYKMEDRVLRYFPAEIEKNQAQAAGFEADIAIRNAHPLPPEGFIGMEVCGHRFSEKEEAGKAIIAAFKSVTSLKKAEIGEYRGFRMSLELTDFGKEYTLTLKGQMGHAVTLGSDPRGNIQRIDNALAAMENRLETVRERIANLEQQREAAKLEIGKPFPQEEELRAKGARLAELDATLDIGGSAPEAMPEQETEDSEKEAPEREEADVPEGEEREEASDDPSYRCTPTVRSRNAYEEVR